MKQRNKRISSLLLALVCALTLTACSSSPASDGGASSGSGGGNAQDFYVKIATGQSGGTYYPVGIALAQVYSDKLPGCVSSAMATGGSVDNVGLLRTDEAQIAMIMSTTARSAYEGSDSFEGNGYSDLRSLCALWENNCQIIVDKSIQRIEDLEGKKFVVGANLSGTETDSRSILSAFGLYYAESDASKNNVEAVYLDYTQGVDALKNGQVAGVMNVSKAPASTVTDLLSTGDYHILTFTEEDIAKISAVNDLYAGYVIPAGTYPNQSEDLAVPGYPLLLCASAGMSDDMAYTLIDTLFANCATLTEAHSAAGSINLDNAVKGLVVPLHPGAEKYLKEQGAL